MKFYGEPLLYVNLTERHRRLAGLRGFRFDESGVYETEHPYLCRLLALKFPSEEPQAGIVEQPKEEPLPEEPMPLPPPTLRHCKKCDFTCDNQGDLLVHYRTVHAKNKG